jgi:NADPH2:quinone reductase
VIATASESSAARVTALGADIVIDYHDPEWTSRARDAAGSSGIPAAANAAPGGERDALNTLVDGGRLATITGAPPPAERGISIANVIIRPDGDELRLLAASLAEGNLHIDIGATYPLTRAAEALAQASKGSGNAIVLEP